MKNVKLSNDIENDMIVIDPDSYKTQAYNLVGTYCDYAKFQTNDLYNDKDIAVDRVKLSLTRAATEIGKVKEGPCNIANQLEVLGGRLAKFDEEGYDATCKSVGAVNDIFNVDIDTPEYNVSTDKIEYDLAMSVICNMSKTIDLYGVEDEYNPGKKVLITTLPDGSKQTILYKETEDYAMICNRYYEQAGESDPEMKEAVVLCCRLTVVDDQYESAVCYFAPSDAVNPTGELKSYNTLATYTECMVGNAVTYDAIYDSLLAAKSDSIDGFNQLVSKYENNLEVSTMINTFKSANVMGGGQGVLNSMKQFFEDSSEIEEIDDGRIGFVNEKNYAPINFLSGIASILVTTIPQIIALIISVFSRVAGVFAFIIAGLISAIVQFINNNVHETAKLDKGELSLYPVPFRRDISEAVPIRPELKKGNGLEYLLLKGAPVYVRNRSYTIIASTIQPRSQLVWSELFIDFIDRTSILSNSNVLARSTPTTEGASYSLEWYASRIPSAAAEDFIRFSPNWGGDGYLDAKDDAKLRFILAFNILYTLINVNLYSYFEYTQQDDPYTCFGYKLVGDLYPDGQTLALYLGYVLKSCYAYQQGERDYEVLTSNLSWDVFYRMAELYRNNEGVRAHAAEEGDYDILLPLIFTNDLANELYYDDQSMEADWQPLLEEPSFAILPGNFDRQQAIIQGIALGAALAAIGSVVAIVGYKVKYALDYRKASAQALVEKEYDKFYHNPTKENYAAYRKAVKANNRLASVLGGTKYSKVNRWDTPTDYDSNGETKSINMVGKIKNKLCTKFALDPSVESSNAAVEYDGSLATDAAKLIAY